MPAEYNIYTHTQRHTYMYTPRYTHIYIRTRKLRQINELFIFTVLKLYNDLKQLTFPAYLT